LRHFLRSALDNIVCRCSATRSEVVANTKQTCKVYTDYFIGRSRTKTNGRPFATVWADLPQNRLWSYELWRG